MNPKEIQLHKNTQPNPVTKKNKNAYLPNLAEIQDFINANKNLYDSFVENIRKNERQEFCSCIKWIGLPDDISSEFLESKLYYRGSLANFYYKNTSQFYFMPYANNGSLDFYGRYQKIKAIPFFQSSEAEKEKARKLKIDTPESLLASYPLEVRHRVYLNEELSLDEMLHSAIIFNDYTPSMNQQCSVVSMQSLNDPIIKLQAFIGCLIKVNQLGGSGMMFYRVPNTMAKNEALSISKDLEEYAKSGIIFIPVVSQLEFQDLSKGVGRAKVEELLMAYQSIDNLRKSNYGLSNNGVYEKKTQMLQDELGQRMSEINTVLKDRLANRQRACLIANSVWGTNLWCDYSEEVINADLNRDGVMKDNKTTENYNINNGGDENV